jgi:hypothetical protein
MNQKTKAKPKKATKRGPKPDTLKLEGNWRNAVKKSLTKEKPVDGWPRAD